MLNNKQHIYISGDRMLHLAIILRYLQLLKDCNVPVYVDREEVLARLTKISVNIHGPRSIIQRRETSRKQVGSYEYAL